MSKNIKEIGKELLGKSLNSFHRKTGLTQLEENNKMQDGILNGILSQVDDAYIEKTEQSNVIHLEGSGDGVVVLDSIEGNTKVNLIKKMSSIFSRTDNINKGNNYLKMNHCLKPNTKYTRFVKVEKVTLNNNNVLLMCDSINDTDGTYRQYTYNITKIGWYIDEITIPSNGTTDTYVINPAVSHFYEGSGTSIEISNIMIVEGSKEDNTTIINFFEGLQSSFEEKVNDEGRYEIEILSGNSNLLNTIEVKQNHTYNETNPFSVYVSEGNQCSSKPIYIKHLQNKYIHIQRILGTVENTHHASLSFYDEFYNKIKTIYDNAVEVKQLVPSNAWYCAFRCKSDNKVLYLGEYRNYYIEPKQNKIKLLINEPLRGLDGNIKDKLLIKDNKLVIERNCNIYKLNSKDIIGYGVPSDNAKTVRFGVYWGSKNDNKFNFDASFTFRSICNILPYNTMWSKDEVGFYCDGWNSSSDDALRQIIFRLDKNIVGSTLNSLKDWIDNNEVIVVYKTLNPIYEEVLNEYGEPILLEGYENGTIYIDSTIIPATTVRYTPKMESFKTLNEVSDNNTMLANDINDNIIPYMMDVDLMIMEKEMALPSQINIRKMEELDMTSMQKRTQDMLERLIKGKTLTEQECKTRVTTYLNAGKITDEQAEELMLVISEIYN